MQLESLRVPLRPEWRREQEKGGVTTKAYPKRELKCRDYTKDFT